jgi:hypothetical protein
MVAEAYAPLVVDSRADDCQILADRHSPHDGVEPTLVVEPYPVHNLDSVLATQGLAQA